MDNLIKVLEQMQQKYNITDDDMDIIGKAIGGALNELKNQDMDELKSKYLPEQELTYDNEGTTDGEEADEEFKYE